MTKPRFTYREHAELGVTLAGIRDELHCRATQLANAYPTSGPEATARNHLLKAVEQLDKARCELDSRLFAEHPDTAEPAVYYPAPDDRATIALPGPRAVR